MNDDETGAWEHKVRQLTDEREGLLELNRTLESDRRNLIDENRVLRSENLYLSTEVARLKGEV